ncbi:MAG: CCA tRNA nucleotidyltransferase [Clostridia bacterium]|nr:CCA tRNA nucleotidyltransferase [Clostridia bacterium]
MLKIPENISLAIDRLTQNGYEAYIVGGCVRDSLLGINPSDFDITTSAKPEEIIRLFEKTIPTGIAHGTVTVMLDNEPIEITTFRTEGRYTDSRHPENVEFVTDLKEDLSRRDFTVNALAFSEKTGLVDLFGGISDLEKKILKAVGDPRERFREDALRILRLFRFSSQLAFSIEENTLNAALELKDGLKNISRERIFLELKKAICGKNPKAILPLINSGALAFLGIEKTPDFYEKTQNPDLRLFSFLKDTKNPIKVLKELKASNRQIDSSRKLLKLSTLEINTKEEIKNALFLTDEASVKSYFEYTDKDTRLLNEILENNEPYLISHLDISGDDLKALGLENREIGMKLEFLRQAVVKNPESNKKETLISLTK